MYQKYLHILKFRKKIQELLSEVLNLSELNLTVEEGLEKCMLPHIKPIVIIGGTGFFEDGGISQPDLDQLMPFYSLYDEYVEDRISKGYKECNYDDYRYYSIGFTTRGCFRRCSFCVNKKYRRSEECTPVSVFVDESRPRIYLWDDNFLSYGRGWEKILDDLNSTGKPFQFRQGLDIRLMTDKKAEILSKSMYYGDYIFAFDHIEDKDQIVKKLRIWRKHCKSTTKLYVLCAYDQFNKEITTEMDELNDIISVFQRIQILMGFGCIPYIMRYEKYKDSIFRDLYIQIARWCNQPQFFKKKSFREYCEANQFYRKTEGTCSAYKALKDFEEKYPAIATSFFDMKYETENRYDLSYNYGRTKCESCADCIMSNVRWDMFVGGHSSLNLLKCYYNCSLDLACLLRNDRVCKITPELASEAIVDAINSVSMCDIITIIEKYPRTSIDVSLIPQFSNYENGTSNLIRVLNKSDYTYEDLAIELQGDQGSSANKKYGENHAKLGALLDLAMITEDVSEGKKRKKVAITSLGRYVLSLSKDEGECVIRKLILRIPIIQQLIIRSSDCEVYLTEVLRNSGASQSTIIRRKPNVTELINRLIHTTEEAIPFRLGRIRTD